MKPTNKSALIAGTLATAMATAANAGPEIEDNGFGPMFVPDVAFTCATSTNAPKGIDLRAMNDTRMFINLDGQGGHGAQFVDADRCTSVVIPQGDGARQTSVVGNKNRSDDIGVFDQTFSFVNGRTPTDGRVDVDRVWVNDDAANLVFEQKNASTIKLRFTNSAGDAAMSEIRYVETVCDKNGAEVTINNNDASSATVTGNQCSDFNSRPFNM